MTVTELCNSHSIRIAAFIATCSGESFPQPMQELATADLTDHGMARCRMSKSTAQLDLYFNELKHPYCSYNCNYILCAVCSWC